MKIHGGRGLLNLPGHESTAAIVAEIEDSVAWDRERKNGERYNREPEYTLQIANCDRSLCFSIAFGKDADTENSLYKIDMMIDTLKAFRKGVAIEQKRYKARDKKIEEREEREEEKYRE